MINRRQLELDIPAGEMQRTVLRDERLAEVLEALADLLLQVVLTKGEEHEEEPSDECHR